MSLDYSILGPLELLLIVVLIAAGPVIGVAIGLLIRNKRRKNLKSIS